jgi:hypothetical protein
MAFVPVVLSLIGPLNLDDEQHEDEGKASKGSSLDHSESRSTRTSSVSVGTSVGAPAALKGNKARWHLDVEAEEDGSELEFHTPKHSEAGSKWTEHPRAPPLL